MKDLAGGDLGNSLTTGQPVVTEIRNRLPASAELTLFGLIISIVDRGPARHSRCCKQGSWIDHACRVVATAGVSLPVFFTGLLLVYVFYFLLGWSPAPLGRLDVFFSAPPHVTGFYLIDSLIARRLRAVSCSAEPIDPAGRYAWGFLPRTDRTHDARLHACGSRIRLRTNRASERPRRPPRSSSLTLSATPCCLSITTLGMVFSFLLGANVLVEKVFAWPGIGSYAVEALIASDFAPVQGFVLTWPFSTSRLI